MKRSTKIGIIIMLIFSLIFYLIVNGGSKSSSISQQQTHLTLELKQDICREIKIYSEYCYETGIDAKTCGEQMVEKVLRLWNLRPEQGREAFDYCTKG